jgi:MinD-like ATPase involved in chromosome partitioning or flagellar assembly
MLIACWSAKGGSGTTVVAATLALLAAHAHDDGALAADLAGDLPAVLGVPDANGPGLWDWLAAAPDVGADALARLEVDAAPGLRLLPCGGGPPADASANGRGPELARHLGARQGVVVVDAGVAHGGPTLDVVAAATESFLVLRPCYLALRRAVAAPLRPSGVILVVEAGRALSRRDVESVLGVSVRAEVDVDPAVARAVDAGLLARRLPRQLERGLRRAA